MLLLSFLLFLLLRTVRFGCCVMRFGGDSDSIDEGRKQQRRPASACPPARLPGWLIVCPCPSSSSFFPLVYLGNYTNALICPIIQSVCLWIVAAVVHELLRSFLLLSPSHSPTAVVLSKVLYWHIQCPQTVFQPDSGNMEFVNTKLQGVHCPHVQYNFDTPLFSGLCWWIQKETLLEYLMPMPIKKISWSINLNDS